MMTNRDYDVKNDVRKLNTGGDCKRQIPGQCTVHYISQFLAKMDYITSVNFIICFMQTIS